MRIRVLGQPIALSMAALALLESSIFGTALLVVGWLRLAEALGVMQQPLGPLWPRALMFSATMAVCLLAFGLYSSRQRARGLGIFARILLAVTAGAVVCALSCSLFPAFALDPTMLALAAVSSAAVVIALRLGVSRLVDSAPLKRRVLVYGAGTQAQAVSQLRRRADQRGFLLAGFVRPAAESLSVPEQRLLRPSGPLLELCRAHQVDEIVVAMDDRRCGFPSQELLECRVGGVQVTDLVSFLERETGRVRLDVLNPSWLIFGKGFSRSSLRLFLSTLLDFTASAALLVITLPLMLATMLAIKLEEGWRAPVLYRQERVGLRGKKFQLLKFRSMRVDAEANGEERWAQQRDPRVTQVGTVIRRTRVDELPQILNVLRGDMSFVGPRPERPQFVASLAQKIPYYLHRHCVKPGITGWAQLCYPYGASDREALEKLEYDLYYIKNSGFVFDLSILVQTAEVVFFGKGAR